MRFLASVLGFLILVAALWAGIGLMRLGETADPDIRRWCDFVELKKYLGRQTPSPKIVAIGASNVIYGLRAGQITAETGVPAVNSGLVFSLGIDIITATARAELMPGDIALLSLEYAFFENRDYNGEMVRKELAGCDRAAFAGLPLTEKAKVLLAQGPVETARVYWRKLRRGLSGAPASAGPPDLSLVDGNNMNAAGDFLQNQAARVTPEMRAALRDNPAGGRIDFSLRSPGARAVADFARWARDRDVTVLATWPPSYWLRRDLAEPGLRRLEAFYASLGIPVLGRATDTMLPLDDFFDSNNHLTAEAAYRRTEALIGLLRPYLPARAAAIDPTRAGPSGPGPVSSVP